MKYVVSIIIFLSAFTAQAQPGKEQEVLKRIEILNRSVFTDRSQRDSLALESLLLQTVTYGHSSGKVESKKEMIHNAMVSPTTYTGFMMDSATVFFEGNNAVCRHVLKAKTMENGKEGQLHLGVLQVWTKENKEWKLLARQAVKLP